MYPLHIICFVSFHRRFKRTTIRTVVDSGVHRSETEGRLEAPGSQSICKRIQMVHVLEQQLGNGSEDHRIPDHKMICMKSRKLQKLRNAQLGQGSYLVCLM